MKLRRLVIDFSEAGGQAIEVLSGRQTPDQIGQLQRWPRISTGGLCWQRFPSGRPLQSRSGCRIAPSAIPAGVWQRWLRTAGES